MLILAVYHIPYIGTQEEDFDPEWGEYGVDWMYEGDEVVEEEMVEEEEENILDENSYLYKELLLNY